MAVGAFQPAFWQIHGSFPAIAVVGPEAVPVAVDACAVGTWHLLGIKVLRDDMVGHVELVATDMVAFQAHPR